MPVVILLDTSLSMTQHVPSTNNTLSRLNLAIHGINNFLDLQSRTNRLDLTALFYFSGSSTLVKGFTRDFKLLKSSLQNIHSSGKTNIIQALKNVRKIVTDEWGPNFNYQLVIVTDGYAVVQSAYLNKQSDLFYDEDSNVDCVESNDWPLPLPSKSKIHIVCLTMQTNPKFQRSLSFYKEIIFRNSPTIQKISDISVNTSYEGGQIWTVRYFQDLSYKIIEELFNRLHCEHFRPLTGKVVCGSLKCPVVMYPNLPNDNLLNKTNQTELEMNICGFLNVDEIANPSIHSKHLVLPMAESLEEFRKWTSFLNVRSDMTDEELMNMFDDEGKQPSFGVLLHGSFKVASMIALCEIIGSPLYPWYGLLYSGMDNKKKSCLMLSTFEPGVDSVPWLSKFTSLGLSSKMDSEPNSFSAKQTKKNHNYVTWLNQNGMQTDIQKLLRYARKLPDKQESLSQEVSRIKKIAVTFNFPEIIEAVATLLEREISLLSCNSHPESSNFIGQVIKYLRTKDST
ncbi:hypothetical protein RDWZM_002384 [Blomia tropicalis]|uniref:Integrator complex subunit 14 n=1 Tax=Blomia tropicalis TaxID=40697 RepID=A0A9Q0RRH9_BLOTA|nr:hypothetical protein RDWZM_002384 [Blomia tropicalis]